MRTDYSALTNRHCTFPEPSSKMYLKARKQKILSAQIIAANGLQEEGKHEWN